MDLTWQAQSNVNYGLAELYTLEQDTASYLTKALDASLNQNTNTNPQQVLDLYVSVTEQLTVNTTHQVNAIVTCTYLSEDNVFLVLDTMLMQSVNPSLLPYNNPKLSFRPYQDSVVLNNYQQSGLTSANLSLVVATCTLSIVLLLVASVLLYITGGWSACFQRVNSCLFVEESDEDEGEFVGSKTTYQENEGYSSQEQEDMENQSVETGMTNPSGILGVVNQSASMEVERRSQDQLYDSNPAAGLGIQTPAREYDLDESTVATSAGRPLGITSMRKLPNPETSEVRGGLAGMIMQRFTHYHGSCDPQECK